LTLQILAKIFFNIYNSAPMSANEVRQKYLDFFKSTPRNHIEIEPAPLVLEEDPTTLFTSSGMQPLVPYLMGETHPKGRRLVDSQPALRAHGLASDDTEEVGDNRHTTFFEMLGNWSLGDYFKKEQLEWFFEFLTDPVAGLGIDPKRLYISVFEGNEFVEKDLESIKIWQEVFKKAGLEAKEGERIFAYPAKKNWWSMTGIPEEMNVGHIGGPDSEVFYDFGENLKIHEKSNFRNEKCHPNCDCGRYLEIGNSVFIQYKKVGDGKFEELSQKNVDFGGGLERLTAVSANQPDIFNTDLFLDEIKSLEKVTGKSYEDKAKKPLFRIICDHLKSASFLINTGVYPSNKDKGYILRKFIRRGAIKLRKLKGSFESDVFDDTIAAVFKIYDGIYLDIAKLSEVKRVISEEVGKFSQTLEKGLREIDKIDRIDAKKAFDLYQTFGFPLEITREILTEKGQTVDLDEYKKEFEKHQELSRSTSAGVFKGGLADHSPEVIKLHTAAHLLLASLRKVLGEQIVQKGQNITRERLRFDFPHPQKLTDAELKKVEDMINGVIKKDLPVKYKVMPKEEAEKTGAIHAFNEKYADTVKVYYVGENIKDAFSKEFCGGPHVVRTSEIGRVRMDKQEKIGAGLMRIYAFVD
jgi:alanyl-tRNA synthetase